MSNLARPSSRTGFVLGLRQGRAGMRSSYRRAWAGAAIALVLSSCGDAATIDTPQGSKATVTTRASTTTSVPRTEPNPTAGPTVPAARFLRFRAVPLRGSRELVLERRPAAAPPASPSTSTIAKVQCASTRSPSTRSAARRRGMTVEVLRRGVVRYSITAGRLTITAEGVGIAALAG